MGDKQHGRPRRIQLMQIFVNFVLAPRVDARRWLIKKQYAGLRNQRAGQKDLLALAARQLADAFVL